MYHWYIIYGSSSFNKAVMIDPFDNFKRHVLDPG